MVIYIVLGVALIILIVVVIRCFLGKNLLKKIMQDSLIICGRKGKGKSKVMSKMTSLARKSGYLSNIDFKHKGQEIVKIKDINCGQNTYEKFLEGDIFPFDKHESWEGKPVFIDDAGVYLPNYADSSLKKKYPSLPIAYALWRHLYDAPIHMNCQDVNRPWKLLKEQADGFILCRGTIKFPFGLHIVRCTYYSKLASCENELKPLNPLLFNKYSKAEVQQYNATNGEIRNFLLFVPTFRHKYDSRAFHKICFGVEAPGRKRKKNPLKAKDNQVHANDCGVNLEPRKEK